MSDNLFGYNLKSVFLYAFLLLAGLACAHYFIMEDPDGTFRNQKLLIALIGFIANFGIIYYHVTTPPHPKFMMSKKRKLSVRLHAIFGSLEIIAGVTAFFTESALAGYVFGISAILHCLTSFYQSPAVFGAKGVMIPAYFFVTCIHLYCGIVLLTDPSSANWILNTFLILNIYAYVRMFMALFEKLHLFDGYNYTTSIVFSGVMILPALMGPIAYLVAICYMLLYAFLAKLVFGLSKEDFKALFHEKARVGLIDPQLKKNWLAANLQTDIDENGINEEFVHKIFQTLDVNGDGKLSSDEIKVLFKKWGISEDALQTIMRQVGGSSGVVTFDKFYLLVKSSTFIADDFKYLREKGAKTDREKAQMVFQELDFDRSGYLESFELELLLLDYGLPSNEVKNYLRIYDDNQDGRISFDEFYEGFAPLWKFAYEVVM